MTTPSKSVRSRAPKKSDDDLFHVHIEIAGTEHVGKGETLVDAFADLDQIPRFINRGIVTMTRKNKRVAAVIHPLILKRVVENKMYRLIWTKLYNRSLA